MISKKLLHDSFVAFSENEFEITYEALVMQSDRKSMQEQSK